MKLGFIGNNRESYIKQKVDSGRRKRSGNDTVILSFLKRERELTVNVILETFRTVDHIQYERFRPLTIPRAKTQ
jgi:hypothetical protein